MKSLLLALGLLAALPLAAQAAVDYKPVVRVDCEQGTDQSRIEWGATNPTEQDIQVHLLFDGTEAVYQPLTVQPGHSATAFSVYEATHEVSLVVGESVIFDQTVPAANCAVTAKPHHTPAITLPPTATALPVEGSADQRPVILLLGLLGILAVGGTLRMRKLL